MLLKSRSKATFAKEASTAKVARLRDPVPDINKIPQQPYGYVIIVITHKIVQIRDVIPRHDNSVL